MSIASEIGRISQAKSDLAGAIESKGVTVPQDATIDDYPALVQQISQGGGLMWVTFTLGEGNSVTADKTVAEVIQAYQDGYVVLGKLPQGDNSPTVIFSPLYTFSKQQEIINITFNSPEPYKLFFISGDLAQNAWVYDYGNFKANSIDFTPGSTGLTATNVQRAIEEVNTKATRTAIPISIPTTGWADNKQTFAVTGIPSDPTTYEVHLSQVGATNVSAAIACGLYIADEAANSLTLAVSSVPEAAFQVYAVVQGVSV